MWIRQTIIEHRRIAGSAAVVLILIAVVYYLQMRKDAPASMPRVEYVDEATLEVTTRAGYDVPPIESDGHVWVIAHHWACAPDCRERTIAYLEKYTDAGKHQVERALSESTPPKGPVGEPIAASGLLVRLPDKGSPWVFINSDDGKRVVDTARSKCPGSGGQECP